MTPIRTRAAGAAIGLLLLSLAPVSPAGAEPARRFTHPDVPTVAIIRTLPSWTDRDPRPAAVEREHLQAQRIINRVCARC